MTKTTEQKFKLHANFWFEISIEDFRDLFCTMGQGSSYWCHEMTVGDIEEDEDGYYLPDQDYEHQGCCAWLKNFDLDTVIRVYDIEEDKHNFKVRDVIKAIDTICDDNSIELRRRFNVFEKEGYQEPPAYRYGYQQNLTISEVNKVTIEEVK